jgi:predicted alpha/beta superfamily hydrolase
MKKIFLFLVFLLINNSFSQYNRSREKIESIELGLDQELEIIIDLPASYSINTKRLYPWIISLDGEHFVDILTSTIKYGNYWDIYPECIIIGINHKGEAHVLEGNHRIRYARDNNISHIHTDVSYFNGGEKAEGKFHPNKVKEMHQEP